MNFSVERESSFPTERKEECNLEGERLAATSAKKEEAFYQENVTIERQSEEATGKKAPGYITIGLQWINSSFRLSVCLSVCLWLVLLSFGRFDVPNVNLDCTLEVRVATKLGSNLLNSVFEFICSRFSEKFLWRCQIQLTKSENEETDQSGCTKIEGRNAGTESGSQLIAKERKSHFEIRKENERGRGKGDERDVLPIDRKLVASFAD